VGKATGLDAMNVSSTTKLFSFKMLKALKYQIMSVEDEEFQEKMQKTC
jgi:hypothetical protein